MDEAWRYTLLMNNTDSELIVDNVGAKYAVRVVPKGYEIIRWNNASHTDTTLPLLRFSTGDVELNPVFSNHDLHENKRIVIFGDLGNSLSCRMTPRTYPPTSGHNDDPAWFPVDHLLGTMGDLEKQVRIWHNQCQHLLKKYQEAVDRVNQVFLESWDFSERDLKFLFIESQVPTPVRQRHFPISKFDGVLRCMLISSMLEGTELLRSCGESSYNQAAFSLTSVPPWIPTFSKFALAIRELAWIVDSVCCVIEGKLLSLDEWEWCEKRCRLVHSDFTNRLDATEDESLEADVRRQNADREALGSSLDLKLSISPGTSSSKYLKPATWLRWRDAAPVQGELESIWRKRLQASSCAPGSFSPLDAFVIDNPETTVVQVPHSTSRNGNSKSVQKCKWLGQTVALATMSNAFKVSAQAETGFLARVQHPNVVEWMGYAFQEDLRNPNYYQECFLVTEYMEWDLHDLITKRLTGDDGKIIENRPPFHFLIAVDIALQIVEAMIHVHKCRVIHRDLKPKNILASRKHLVAGCGVLIRYTTKLIDFGSSKSGDQGSYFDTRKQGTPIYMAPEVWESEDSYSWSADVYSFGLTCFEIFTGRLPFDSGMALIHANIQKVLRGEISFPFDYPGELQSLIAKCWAQNPSDRPCFEDIRKALWQLKVDPSEGSVDGANFVEMEHSRFVAPKGLQCKTLILDSKCGTNSQSELVCPRCECAMNLEDRLGSD